MQETHSAQATLRHERTIYIDIKFNC